MKKHMTEGCKAILQRMLNRDIIGGKHIPVTFCRQWITHLSKSDYKKALKDFEWCMKEGLVLKRPKPSAMHVSLDPERLPEVRCLVNNEKKEN